MDELRKFELFSISVKKCSAQLKIPIFFHLFLFNKTQPKTLHTMINLTYGLVPSLQHMLLQDNTVWVLCGTL